MNEDLLHQLAVNFMDQFPELENDSLDDFLKANEDNMSRNQYVSGLYIIELIYLNS